MSRLYSACLTTGKKKPGKILNQWYDEHNKNINAIWIGFETTFQLLEPLLNNGGNFGKIKKKKQRKVPVV